VTGEVRWPATKRLLAGIQPRIAISIALSLKRARTLVTGQRFNTINAMSRNVVPYRYPDFAEAKARYIQLFEQHFEWSKMTYVFYSDFWSQKGKWLTLAQLADDLSLFNFFLKIGAARAQVRVPREIESSVLDYFGAVDVRDAEGNLIS